MPLSDFGAGVSEYLGVLAVQITYWRRTNEHGNHNGN